MATDPLRGRARLATFFGLGVLAAVGGACGDDPDSAGLARLQVEPGTVRSANIEHDFSPVVQLDMRDRWRPLGPNWFLRNSRRVPGDVGRPAYLDLRDEARPGPRPSPSVRAHVERHDEQVAGGPGVRLTYWLLFGMNEPRDGEGRVLRHLAHEGDWERFEVLLRKGEQPNRYRPVAVRLHVRGRSRDIPWRRVEHVPGGRTFDARHPVTRAARGGHELSLGTTCRPCFRWETWGSYRDARDQHWYGYPGLWGEPGAKPSTSGPRGPGAG